MELFWKDKKYQKTGKCTKLDVINEFENEWECLKPEHIRSLPAFSALKPIFKEWEFINSQNVNEKKELYLKEISEKTTKRRKSQWQYKQFDEKLLKKIKSISDSEFLREWIGYFLEYYRLIKCENKND